MAENWKKIRNRARTFALTDPYFEWLRATKFAYYRYRRKSRFHVIIELQTPAGAKKPVTAKRFALGDWGGRKPPADWNKWLRIPAVFARPAKGLTRTTFCTATVTRQFFRQVSAKNSSLSRVVKRFQLGNPTVPDLGPGAVRPKKPSIRPNKRRTVVTGIIDDGLAFAHERFRRQVGGTRIEFFWDQDERWGIGLGPGIYIPDLADYGRELRKHDFGGVAGIDTLTANATYAGLVDEDEVYRVAGHSDYGHSGHKAVNWRTAHGTHVMDLAYGFDPANAPAGRPIICVQLPARTTADTSGRRLDPFILHGLRYILARADELGGGTTPRVVVNLSYGVIAPNEYTEILVAAIDQLIRERNVPLAVVLPSGNSHLSRCHARFSLQNIGDSRPMEWRVPPDDLTESFLEIWLPSAIVGGPPYPFRVRVQVTTPTGDVSGWITRGGEWNWQPASDVLCQVVYQDAVAILNRDRITIQLAPTSTQDPALDVAPSGPWQILVENLGDPVDMVAWIQRDDTPYGYPRRGRQSRFEDPNYVRDDPISGREIEVDNAASYVKRDGSINRLATSSETIVMGGFRRKDLIVAKYSAGGSNVPPAGVQPPAGVLPPFRNGPDAVAVTGDSVTCHGVLAAGSRSGSVVAMNGTSVAAPQIARWAARRMGLNLPVNRAAVAAAAVPGLPPGSPVQPPPERVGAGRIELPPIKPRPPIRRFEP